VKKFFWVVINLILIVATEGLWLILLLIYFVVRRSNKLRPDKLLSSSEAQPNGPAVVTLPSKPFVSEKTKQTLQSNWKLITGLSLVAVLLVVSVSFGTRFLNDRESNQLFAKAQEKINADDFKGARIDIDQALRGNPSASQRANELRTQINGIQQALKLFAVADKALLEDEILVAAKTLRRVTSDERDFRKKAERQLMELEGKVQGIVSERISKLKTLARYEEAREIIIDFASAYPDNMKFSEEAEEISNLLEKQRESKKRIALSKLKRTYDEFQNVTWYQSPSSPRYRSSNAFYVYFGVESGSKLPLRLVMQYFSSDWLFIQEAKINIDGSIYTIDNTDWERDNDSDIWEWSDELLDRRDLIEKIIKSKSAIIRYEGRQYYDNRTISSSQKLALKQVLEAYDALD